MPYIGKDPGTGLRGRFIYTATAGQTTFSGSDSLGRTLTYTDSEYTDVYLNGVKLDKADYTATSGTSIVLDSGATAGDLLEVLAFDTFGLFSGEFAQDVTVAGDLTVSGTTTTAATTMTGDLSLADKIVHTGDTNTAIRFPAADTVTVETGGSERVRVLSDGKIGLGTTTPENPIEIETANTLGSTFTGTTHGEGLRVTQSSYSSGNFVSLVEAPYQPNGAANVRIAGMFDGGGSNLAFGTSNSYGSGITNTAMFIHSSGNVQLSGGISFAGNDVETAANKLDDYEEGTWTPVVSDATSGGNTASGSFSGIYTKIGRLVTAILRAENINTTGMTGANALIVQGLPFTNGSSSPNVSTGALRTDNLDIVIDSAYGMNSNLFAGVSYLDFRINRDTTTDLQLKVNQVNSGSADLHTTITYMI